MIKIVKTKIPFNEIDNFRFFKNLRILKNTKLIQNYFHQTKNQKT